MVKVFANDYLTGAVPLCNGMLYSDAIWSTYDFFIIMWVTGESKNSITTTEWEKHCLSLHVTDPGIEGLIASNSLTVTVWQIDF